MAVPGYGREVPPSRVRYRPDVLPSGQASPLAPIQERPHLGSPALSSALTAPRVDPHPVGFGSVYVQRSPDQAVETQLRAWALRGVQGLIAGLGLKNLVPSMVDMTLGLDTLHQPIRAHLIPGQIDEVALVVAGVHGSEQSGVEVADLLLAQLAVHRPFFTVVVVPRLFPDNVAGRADWEKQLAKDQGKIALKKYRELRGKADDPGRVTAGQVDPNRQFPELGADLDLANPVDAKGRPVEPGNLALLALIRAFAPTRIASIHAQKDLDKAGVFSDPQPVAASNPLSTTADQVAIATAKRASGLGARVTGNTRGRKTISSLYPGQDPKISKAKMAVENTRGRSFGQWGPSKGIAVLTIEVAEQYGSAGAVDDPKRAKELEAHATALREIFLGPPPTPTAPAGSGASAPATGVQRLVVAGVGAQAGNRAATASLARMRVGQPPR